MVFDYCHCWLLLKLVVWRANCKAVALKILHYSKVRISGSTCRASISSLPWNSPTWKVPNHLEYSKVVCKAIWWYQSSSPQLEQFDKQSFLVAQSSSQNMLQASRSIPGPQRLLHLQHVQTCFFRRSSTHQCPFILNLFWCLCFINLGLWKNSLLKVLFPHWVQKLRLTLK